MAISIPFSEEQSSVYIYQMSKELWKMLYGSSSIIAIFALSNHTTFSQTQTGTTVPLKI
jgi:anti-sigma-K factor RskA